MQTVPPLQRSIQGALVIALLLAIAPAAPAAAQKKQPTAKEQLEFGVEMAKRGLWSEALFRFKRARALAPENPAVYNNMAVAHEALGLFEDALALYRQGLEIDPQDKGLRNNYARFLDFYKRFKPEEEDEESSDEPAAEQSKPESTLEAGSLR